MDIKDNNNNLELNFAEDMDNNAAKEEKTEIVEVDANISAAEKTAIAEAKTASNEVDSYISGLDDSGASQQFDYKVKLDAFEGPLDLLLHLIKEAKIKIEDIFVSKITEQYLDYMNEIKLVDLDRASEFIEMAAWLLEIKSKSMLPKPVIENPNEEDPKKALIQRLEEYKIYKEASLKIKEMETIGIHYRDPDPTVGNPQLVIKDITMDGLTLALQKLFLKLEQKSIIHKDRQITMDRFTVADKIQYIKDFMTTRENASFFDLFNDDYTKNEVITTFQAMLELLKLQFMTVEQKEVFGEIVLRKTLE